MTPRQAMLLHGQLVVGDTCRDGWLRVADGIITDVGGPAALVGDHADHEVFDFADCWIVPGFVDLHSHGGDRASYASARLDDIRRVAALHRRHGTTTTLASVVTGPVDDMVAAVSALADAADDEVVAGIHIEGPFLNPARRGAQNPAYLRTPDSDVLARLLRAGRGHVRVVTVAPELDGGIDLVRRIADAGAIAAVGHTDATYDQAIAAFRAGARLATHLFNGMRPMLSREGGAVAAALNQPDIVVEVVNDGVHVAPPMVSIVARLTEGRLAFVTDAMAAAGAGDGDYILGEMQVRVVGGVASLADGSSIAGSTLTMDAALRRAVHEEGLSLPQAAAAVSSVPARLLSRSDIGLLAPGNRADVVVLDADLQVSRVMARGEWVDNS